MKKAPSISAQGYTDGMEFTDYMLWKLGIITALAFLYGLIFGKRR
jgi:hypothetical protein